jgi:hypothetical protein
MASMTKRQQTSTSVEGFIIVFPRIDGIEQCLMRVGIGQAFAR